MINFYLHDTLNVKIETDNWDYLRAVKDHFSYYAKNYKFMPRYKAGLWDGKIPLFSTGNQTLPFGLTLKLLKYHKQEWNDIPYNISPDVKALFTGIKPEYNKDLLFSPYDYQDDCISTCLSASKGIIRSATASGKSVMISYVMRELWEKGLVKNGIIIVPSISLVTQFYNDMDDYGIDMSLIGRVGEDWKEWDKPMVISTWQSLQNVPHHMERMDGVVVDECLSGDTLIRTINGQIPIKDVKIDDIIISYSMETNTYENDVVENVYSNMIISSDEKIYELEFDNGDSLKITGNHKILTDEGYIRADELTENHNVISFS